MKIDIQTVGFNAREDLLASAKQKIDGLTKFYERITGVDLYFKLVQDDQEDNKEAQIKIHLPGPTLFAHHRSDNFYESLNEVTEKIIKQLKKKNQLEKEKR